MIINRGLDKIDRDLYFLYNKLRISSGYKKCSEGKGERNMEEQIVIYKDILDANERIIKYIYNTPMEYSMHLSNMNMSIYLKLECQQVLKGFKIRGALNKLISLGEEERNKGVWLCLREIMEPGSAMQQNY